MGTKGVFCGSTRGGIRGLRLWVEHLFKFVNGDKDTCVLWDSVHPSTLQTISAEVQGMGRAESFPVIWG